MAAPQGIAQLGVVLTAQCDLRCSYCYQDARPPGHVPWATLERGIDRLRASTRADAELVFLGGEPLLEFDLLRRAVLNARGGRPPRLVPRVTVLTNGMLLSDEVAEFLAAEDVAVHLSFDGVREAQDARAPGTFEAMDGLLDRLRETHPRFFRRNLAIVITLTPSNVPLLAASFDYFLAKDVRRILIGPVITPTPVWGLGDIDGLRRQIGRMASCAGRHFSATGRAPLASPCAEEAPSPGGLPMCGIGRRDAFVLDADGEAYACAAFARSYQRTSTALLEDAARTASLGRLEDACFEERLAALPDSVARLPLFSHRERKRSGYRACLGCPHLGACRVCPAALARGGDPDRVPDFLCAWNTALLERLEDFPKSPTLAERVREGPRSCRRPRDASGG